MTRLSLFSTRWIYSFYLWLCVSSLAALPPKGIELLKNTDAEISIKVDLLEMNPNSGEPDSSIIIAVPYDGSYHVSWRPENWIDPLPPDAPGLFELTTDVWYRQSRIISIRFHSPSDERNAKSTSDIFEYYLNIHFFLSESVEEISDSKWQDSVLENLVINPVQARKWRKPVETDRFEFQSSWYKPGATYYKIAVTENNLYKITNQIDFTGVDPGSIQMFNRGIEIPIFISGENDGVFDPGDFIEFYGEKNSSPEDAKYSDTNIYWLTWGTTTGMRMMVRDGTPVSGTQARAYEENRHVEENHVYFYSEYYWEPIYARESKNYTVTLDAIDSESSSAIIRFRCRGMTTVAEINPDHHVQFFLNGVLIADIYFDGYDVLNEEITIPASLLASGTNIFKVFCPGDTPAGEVDGIYFDWFDLRYQRNYRSNRLTYFFHSPLTSSEMCYRYQIDNIASTDIELVRLTGQPERITQFELQPDGLSYHLHFSDDAITTTDYIVSSISGIPAPDRIWIDTFSDLRAPASAADYIIITHSDFADALDPLVSLRTSQGMRVAVVDIEDIYDEFNEGIFNPESIRSFVDYAYHNWTTPPPSFILLVGDATWDYKRYLDGSIMDNYVPAYTKTWNFSADSQPRNSSIADDPYNFYYGNPMVDDQFVCVSGDDNLPDLAIGRFAVQTLAEAQICVQKTLKYDSYSRDQSWQKRLIFINGGFNDMEQALFAGQSETIIRTFLAGSGFSWKVKRIYKETNDFSWGTYEEDIRSAIDQGALLVNFFGHAGSWSWEAMFDFDDISTLNNQGILPVIQSMTCNTARFANPQVSCFGEAFQNTATAETGSAAFFGGCNFGGYWTDYYLAYYLYYALFTMQERTYGTAIQAAKIVTLLKYPGYSVLLEPYTLLGDPALKIATPSAPQIMLAGYMDSYVSAANGGSIQILAYATDPDGLDHIDRLELTVGKTPTGVLLMDDGFNGDFGAGDGWFGLRVSVPPQAIGPGIINIGILGVDVENNQSFLYPLCPSSP